ncbi:MarR family transcriptional regulator [Glycomyces luteolus]|uniref:MarR family transcriptional regulator n=1 Tax=Glycomyces luteolus TaxID=2670330 RepID=A0A9X3PBF5_9ACTN|nr:MarR family transcriptional regulator [Glycomyces luteolus]MDA1362313.1 MarR family transcriptional regulator [Glycomyces luteolus]
MPDLKSFFHELVYYQVELWEAMDALLQEECGLPLTWFEIMDLLQRRSAARVQDIAAAFSISVGGTSKVVDKLEAGGLCRRMPNPADRRSSLIELTDHGRASLERANEIFNRELASRIGSVASEQDLDQMLATLSRLRDAGRALGADHITERAA